MILVSCKENSLNVPTGPLANVANQIRCRNRRLIYEFYAKNPISFFWAFNIEMTSVPYLDKILKENPKQAAHMVRDSLKENLGQEYNLWKVLAELDKRLESWGFAHESFIDNGNFVIVLKQDKHDERMVAFAAELLEGVFKDLSRLKYEVRTNSGRVVADFDLNSISKG